MSGKQIGLRIRAIGHAALSRNHASPRLRPMDTCIRSDEQVQFFAPGGPPAQGPPAELSRRDARWLAGLQLWAGAIVRRLRVPEADIGPLVLDAFARVAMQWTGFEAPPEL